MVNILAINSNAYGTPHFSFLFDTSEEVQSIKNSIKSYTGFQAPYLHLIYESNLENEHSSMLLNLIKCWANFLFIVGTKSGEKFAFFFQESITPNNQGFFQSLNHRCFLFSFIK